MALKLDTREPGMVLSGVAHVALLGAALFAATSRPLPPAEEGIPVEVITENQLSEITKGETTAKVALPDPKPRAERQADVRVERDPGEAPKDVPSPPTRPAEVKVADEPVEAAAAPPPPPPPPARPPEKTPEPPKREAEKQPDPTPVPQPPRRQDVAAVETDDAEALAKAEAQKARAEAQAKAAAQAKAKAEADAKRLAEAEEKAKAKAEAEARAKQMADLKAKADAKAKAEAEARAKKQAELAEKSNPGDISRLLQSREAPQSSGSAAREVQKTASLGTAAGTAQRLNPSQRDALMGLLRDQLHRCWQAPLAATTSDKPPVPSVRVKLNQDGSLAAEPAVVNSSGDPLFRVVADSATRATRRCAPLRIPAQFQPYYQDWKDLVVNFDPREMG